MPETMGPGPVGENMAIREATCIHAKKVFDSCQSKDCIEDLRLFPTATSAELIERAVSIKAGNAELLYAAIDVQAMGFNRGFYTIDIRYFYKVNADAFVGSTRSLPVTGLAVFDKRSILFGSGSGAKMFSSEMDPDTLDAQSILNSDLPTAILEAVDPVVLNIRLSDYADPNAFDCGVTVVPPAVQQAFGEELVFNSQSARRVYVTLGQFSILRLEREAQLLMPIYDYCIPDKECANEGCEEDPCELFSQVEFPVNEFYPPSAATALDPLSAFRAQNTRQSDR
ncbi:MAG: hypothetical protein LUD79_08195 [Oscillospiraceae bacterium]|nr:hypothetical protein [Oscillospiraceae bacterium]